jgi:hypothetical protein
MSDDPFEDFRRIIQAWVEVAHCTVIRDVAGEEVERGERLFRLRYEDGGADLVRVTEKASETTAEMRAHVLTELQESFAARQPGAKRLVLVRGDGVSARPHHH